MALRNISIRVLKATQQKFYFCTTLIITFLLVACINQSTPIEQDVAAQPSTQAVIQVDGTITADNVLQVDNTIEPNNNPVLLTLAGAVSPQGDRTITVENRLVQNGTSEQGTVTLLDSNGNQLAQRDLQWFVGPVLFTPNGQRIITSGSDRITRIWDTQLNEIASFDGHQTYVQSLQVSPDGNSILTTEYPDGIYPPQTWGEVVIARLLDLQATELASWKGLLIGPNRYKYTQFSPDGQRLLIVTNGAVQLTDLQGTPQLTFNQNQPNSAIAQFSLDGRSVLAAGQGTMQLWDLQGTLKTEFTNWTLAPEESIASIQLTHDGQLVVTGSSNGIMRFWDAESGQVVTVKAHEGAIHAIAISPDGTQVVTLGEKIANSIGDNNIRVWNLQGGLL